MLALRWSPLWTHWRNCQTVARICPSRFAPWWISTAVEPEDFVHDMCSKCSASAHRPCTAACAPMTTRFSVRKRVNCFAVWLTRRRWWQMWLVIKAVIVELFLQESSRIFSFRFSIYKWFGWLLNVCDIFRLHLPVTTCVMSDFLPKKTKAASASRKSSASKVAVGNSSRFFAGIHLMPDGILEEFGGSPNRVLNSNLVYVARDWNIYQLWSCLVFLQFHLHLLLHSSTSHLVSPQSLYWQIHWSVGLLLMGLITKREKAK